MLYDLNIKQVLPRMGNVKEFLWGSRRFKLSQKKQEHSCILAFNMVRYYFLVQIQSVFSKNIQFQLKLLAQFKGTINLQCPCAAK